MRALPLALLLLAGCGSVVPTTLARLSALSPLEADPADIAVSLQLPAGLGVKPGSAKISVQAERSDTNESFSEGFVLARSTGSDGSTVYQVAASDHARFKALQDKAQSWEAENSKATSGSLSVGLEGCTIGPGPSDDATLSVSIRTEADGTFLPLIRDAALDKVLDKTEAAQMGPCP